MNVMTVTDGMADAQIPVKNDPQGDVSQGFASELNRASGTDKPVSDKKAAEAPKTPGADQPEDRPNGAKDEKSKDTDVVQAAALLQGPIPVVVLVQTGEAAAQAGAQAATTEMLPEVKMEAKPEAAGTVTGTTAGTAVQPAQTAQPAQPPQAQAVQPAQTAAVQAATPAETDSKQQTTGQTAQTFETAVQTATEGRTQTASPAEAAPQEDKAQAFANQAVSEIDMLQKAAQDSKQPAAAAEMQPAQPVMQAGQEVKVQAKVEPKVQANEQQPEAQPAAQQADTQDVKAAAGEKPAGDDMQGEKKGNAFQYHKQDAAGMETQAPAWPNAGGNTAAVQFKTPQPQPEPVVQRNIATSIVDSIKTAADKGKTELVVQLKPEHLGGLEISLTMGEGGLTAKMVTSQESVQNMIHNQIGMLQDTLREKGIPVVHMEVVYDQTQNSAGFSHNGNGGQWAGQDNGNSHSYRETEETVNYYNFMSSYEVLAEHGGSVEFSA